MSIQDLAVMPLADYEAACDAIRAKDGSSGSIVSGQLASKINAIPTGYNTSDATIVASDLPSGKIGYGRKGKLTGTATSKAAATYNVSSSNQTIAAGQFLAGAQTIRAVKTTNIEASYIKKGVTVKVGDANDDDRILNVTGTYDGDTVTLTGSGSNGIITVPASSVGNKNILAWEIYGGNGSGVVYEAFGWTAGGTGFAYAGSYQSSSIYHQVSCSASKGETAGSNLQIWFNCSTSGYSFSGSYSAKIIFG